MSTGYLPRIIRMERPSSSGQTMTVSTGCIIDVKAGAVLKIPLEANSSLDTSMTNFGLSVIESTIANTFTMSAPQVGIRKSIVSYSTLAQTIRGSSAVGVRFGSTAGKYYSVVITNTTKTELYGTALELVGESSVQWQVVSVTTARTAFSTACT